METGDDKDGYAVEHVHEVFGRRPDALGLGGEWCVIGGEACRAVVCCALAIQLGQLRTSLLFGDDDESPPLGVAAGRCLLGKSDAVEDHVSFDASVEVEPTADRSSRREK